MVNFVKELKFKDFNMFIRKRKQLRIYYIFLSKKEKRSYKQYIYNLQYKDYILDIIWCYLNEPKNSVDYVFDSQLLDYYRLYQRNNKVFDK